MNWTQRAQPHLGTLVVIQLAGVANAALARHAYACAFETIAHIGKVMSAHDPSSDLGRLARAEPGSTLTLDPHTVTVLGLARHWYQQSAGAFDPIAAAHKNGRQGLRPAFDGLSPPNGVSHWQNLHLVNDTQVKLDGPLWLDLGGIAKGYAVDLAIAALRHCGIQHAVVNAGGDLRTLGAKAWQVAARHTSAQKGIVRCQTSHRLQSLAMATSDSSGAGTAFVRTGSRAGHRLGSRLASHASSCTVTAPDCVTADALTKWGLQAPPNSQRLQRALRRAGARMWRTA